MSVTSSKLRRASRIRCAYTNGLWTFELSAIYCHSRHTLWICLRATCTQPEDTNTSRPVTHPNTSDAISENFGEQYYGLLTVTI